MNSPEQASPDPVTPNRPPPHTDSPIHDLAGLTLEVNSLERGVEFYTGLFEQSVKVLRPLM